MGKGDFKQPGWTEEPLPHEEQLELWRRYKAGDRRAADKLLRTNVKLVMRYVWKFAGGFLKRRPDLWDDLLAEALAGFMHGVTQYEEGHGTAVSSYASLWVQPRVQVYLERYLGVVTLGRTARQRQLFAGLGRQRVKTAEERAFSALYQDVSLDEPLTPEYEASVQTRGDLLTDESEPVDEQLVMAEETDSAMRRVRHALSCLSQKQRTVIEMTVLNDPPMKLDEAGSRLGVTRERVRQLRLMGLRRMSEVLGREVDPQQLVYTLRESGYFRRAA